ncbi:Protein fmp32, mitochondrial [Naganishia albida]|nr:Protein fmp32, mitochondrial [Naganishia albida]
MQVSKTLIASSRGLALRRLPVSSLRRTWLAAQNAQRPFPVQSAWVQNSIYGRCHAFHTSTSALANHFDTHQFVEELTREGLSRQQAEGVMAALAEVVDESIAGMSATMVTKAEQEKLHYTQKVDFAQLKSELQLHEKNDLTLMKQENDQLRGDVEKLKQRLREEITRTMAGVRLDLNLEKGRIRDESSQQELKIKEVDTRIESEIAGLRTQIEQAKFSILQYLVGVATGAGALLLAYLRMFK